ncbi:response regulator [Pseudorhodoferax sp.]|uniref:response regulator n=1 Tax=Pseudorhodoferax sp. TaxID=1993553 RepID=UPI0039E454DD
MTRPADHPARILVVEDEPRLAAVLCDYLKAARHETEWVADGLRVPDVFRRWRPDLVLLDLMLPGADGVDLCRALRADSDVPVIMVTARVAELDRLLGLEVGADDYICKPFSPREVVARVGVVLRRYRRTGAAAPDGLQIDEPGCRAALHGRWLELTPVEFRLLRTLAGAPGRVWSRDRLMDHLYTDHRIVTDRTVDSHVKNLRRKLAEAGASGDPIASIYGVGYRFDME